MKKTGLFKIIMFVLLGIAVCSWLVSAAYLNEGELVDLGMTNVGIFDFFKLMYNSLTFEYFLQIFIFLMSVGALYGVLVKTGKYRAWVDRIAANFKGVQLVFLLAVAFIIAALTSVFDYGLLLFTFFPLIISIILAMGYDKITAALVTFGAVLVGTIGNTLGYTTSGSVDNIIGSTINEGIIFKVILFMLSLIILFVFLAKAKTSKKEKEANEESDLFIGEKISNKYPVWPIITIFGIIFVLLVLGCTTWKDSFGIDTFETIHEKIMTAEVKLPTIHLTLKDGKVIVKTAMEKVAILGKVFGSIGSFGNWYYTEMAIINVIAALIIGVFYRIKLSERVEAMAEGAKKMLKPALFVLLAYMVVFFAGNTYFYTLIEKVLLSVKVPVIKQLFSVLNLIFGSVLHVDLVFISNYVLPLIAEQTSDGAVVATSLLIKGIYGSTMLLAPTSVMLALGLNYLGITYKEWFKKTWIIATILLVVVCAMSGIAYWLA